MGAARRKTPRKYLRADERREQLLAVAAELVGKGGWDALGMIPLAEAAGVSRQLVYEHFENLDTLQVEVTRFLFAGVFRTVAEVLERYPDDPAAADRLRDKIEDDLQGLGQQAYFSGVEYYLPFLYPEPATLLDYLPGNSAVAIDEPSHIVSNYADFQSELNEMVAARLARGALLPQPESLYQPVEVAITGRVNGDVARKVAARPGKEQS